MNCKCCGIETKNPSYCSVKCSAKINSPKTAKRKPEGTCAICQCCISKSRKYCKDCFTTSRLQQIKDAKVKNCLTCKIQLDSSNAYISKGNMNPYCKICFKHTFAEKRKGFKQRCVDYKGGKCERCGYCKNISALQFHHSNPDEKEFSISVYSGYILSESILLELDKCELLCANCHFEHHNPN